MRLAALAVVLQMSHAFSSGTTLNAKAWGFDPSSWPEMTANLAGFSTERPNSGMANAGNGWAAYMITQGGAGQTPESDALFENLPSGRVPELG